MIMNQFKRAQVVIKSSNNMLDSYKSSITKIIEDNNKLYNNPKQIGEFITELGQPQHLYIISDDEIKDGDWKYCNTTGYITQYQSNNNAKHSIADKCKNCRKIIATTDTSLKLDSTLNEFAFSNDERNILPQPSQQFIQKYIEEYNKGNIITDVLVEYEPQSYNNRFDLEKEIGNSDTWGKRLQLKVNPKDNTITIKKLKEFWNREEVIELLSSILFSSYEMVEHYSDGSVSDYDTKEFNKWIEKNL